MAKKSESEKDGIIVDAADSEAGKAMPGDLGKSAKKSGGRTAKPKPGVHMEPEEPTAAAQTFTQDPSDAQTSADAEKPPVTDADKTEGGPIFVGAENFEGREESTGKGASARCGVVCSWLGRFKPEGFCAALSFLSRLGAGRERSEEEMRASVAFYPLVGLLLGLLALIPVWLVPAGYFWLKAWVFSALLLWLTRGLHWDGLADLADALGSGRRGEGFQEVLKDSRSGVFAVLAVVFCALGYVFAAQSLLLRETWLPLALAPAFGRCVPLYISNLSRPNAASSLGKLMERATDLKAAVAWTCALTLIAVLAGYILAAFLTLAFSAALLYWLLNLAERQGGYNGDFMGAGIVLVELGTLLAFALG